MKVAILTSVSQVSSKALADHLNQNGIVADVYSPYKDNQGNPWKQYDYIFKYGCSYPIPNETFGKGRDRVLNNTEAVKNCVDKWETFRVFRENDIPTVRHWVDLTKIPGDVTSLVVRKDRCGRKAEGYDIWDRDSGKPIPYADLYTEYFFHQREYRITVFKGKAFIYYKKFEGGYHEFMLSKSPASKQMVADAVKAANALNMDFVSFDVVAKTFKDYAFLEANSGTILTDEVSLAIVQWFLDKE